MARFAISQFDRKILISHPRFGLRHQFLLPVFVKKLHDAIIGYQVPFATSYYFCDFGHNRVDSTVSASNNAIHHKPLMMHDDTGKHLKELVSFTMIQPSLLAPWTKPHCHTGTLAKPTKQTGCRASCASAIRIFLDLGERTRDV
jgi:hypothetical protein